MKMTDQKNEIEMMAWPMFHCLFRLYKKSADFEKVVYDLPQLLRNWEVGLKFRL